MYSENMNLEKMEEELLLSGYSEKIRRAAVLVESQSIRVCLCVNN